MKNEEILFCLLMILDNHLTHMIEIKISSLAVFGSDKKVDDMISLLYFIGNKNSSIASLCYNLMIKLICISDFYEGEKLNNVIGNLFLKEGPVKVEQIEEKFSIYKSLFTFLSLSKKNLDKFLTVEKGKELNRKLLEFVFEHENEVLFFFF